MRFNLHGAVTLTLLLLLSSSNIIAIEETTAQPTTQESMDGGGQEQIKDELNNRADDLQPEPNRSTRMTANVIQITKERKQLRAKVADLTFTVEDLRLKNLEMSNQNNQYWFLLGAGAILLGVVIGLILPHMSLRRKRRSWDSF